MHTPALLVRTSFNSIVPESTMLFDPEFSLFPVGTRDIPAFSLQTFFDFDGDRVFDYIISDTYTADDRILSRVVDSNADRQADAVTSYTYNSSGGQTGLFLDSDNNGTIDYSLTTDYTTDTDGHLTVTATSQDNISGSNDVYISKYDSAGNLIEESVGTSGGTPEVTALYNYNDAGQITLYETASLGRTEYSYDAVGRISGFMTFFNGETFPSNTGTYLYNEAGILAEQKIVTSSKLNTTVETYNYDEAGRLIESTSTSRTRQFIPAINQAQYEYNEAGKVTSFLSQSQFAGSLQQALYTYEYDAAGNLVKEVFDESNDGDIESITHYSYGGDGGLTYSSVDLLADGIVDSAIGYAYGDLLAAAAIPSSLAASNGVEADIFADEVMAQVVLGTGDVFSGNELASSGWLESSTLLETDASLMPTEQFL